MSAIFTKQSDANIGVNFAIDAQLVEVFVEQTADGSPFLPVKTGVLAQQVPAPGEAGREGIRVARLVPGSAGEAAGLQPGDVIYSAGGRRIRKPQDWLSVMASARRGRPVAVEFARRRQGNGDRTEALTVSCLKRTRPPEECSMAAQTSSR